MTIILVVDVGKFEISGDLITELQGCAERVHQSLREGNRSKLQEEYGALFTILQVKGTRISLVDPRPVDMILPSPNADYELLHRIFISGA